MSDYFEMIEKQIEMLERQLEDANYKGQMILADRIRKKIAQLHQDSGTALKHRPLEKLGSCI